MHLWFQIMKGDAQASWRRCQMWTLLCIWWRNVEAEITSMSNLQTPYTGTISMSTVRLSWNGLMSEGKIALNQELESDSLFACCSLQYPILDRFLSKGKSWMVETVINIIPTLKHASWQPQASIHLLNSSYLIRIDLVNWFKKSRTWNMIRIQFLVTKKMKG